MGFEGSQTGGDGNGSDHQVEEDEENRRRKPAAHGSPDRHGFFKHGSVLSSPQKAKTRERERERERKE